MALEWRYLLVMMVLVTFWELLFFSIISLLISWGGGALGTKVRGATDKVTKFIITIKLSFRSSSSQWR